LHRTQIAIVASGINDTFSDHRPQRETQSL
jgi:hypothetical protein